MALLSGWDIQRTTWVQVHPELSVTGGQSQNLFRHLGREHGAALLTAEWAEPVGPSPSSLAWSQEAGALSLTPWASAPSIIK